MWLYPATTEGFCSVINDSDIWNQFQLPFYCYGTWLSSHREVMSTASNGPHSLISVQKMDWY
jgi:hypothetical protein